MADNLLLQLAVVFCTAGLWLATVAFVLWDGQRRALTAGTFTGWAVLAFVLPFLGALLYLLFGRRAPRTRPERGTVVMRSPLAEPAVIPAAAPPAGGAEETQSTVPAAFYRQQGQRGAAAGSRQRGLALDVTFGPHSGESHVLDALPACIGRSAECEVRLVNDQAVSRRHAELYSNDGTLYVRDLGSTHGTRVNGYRVSEYALQPGDEVQVGHTLFVVRG